MAQKINSSELSPANNSLTLEYWEQRWLDGTSFWHEQDGNSLLWKHFDIIISESFPTKQPQDLKVFVPLCGKSKDMFTLYQRGFTVVGVEFSKQPIREFFQENAVTVDSTAEGDPYTMSGDGRLQLCQGDLFSFTADPLQSSHSLPFPKYDIIWDRGAFIAMNMNDRSKYAAYIQALLESDGVYILCGKDYNLDEYGGPPLAVNEDGLVKYFGATMSVNAMESKDLLAEGSEARQKWLNKGLTRMTETLYKLKTRRKNE